MSCSSKFDVSQLQRAFETITLDDESCCQLVTAVRGVCESMCPDEEIEQRGKQFLIHPLEATPETALLGQRLRKPDRGKMVKCYSRPAAGKEFSRPDILRPFTVLKRTVAHLLRLTTSSQHSWNIVYDFVCDRLRSVRQDMIIQELGSRETMELLGPVLNFYFYSKHRCETQECSGYDASLHASQMDECTDRLLVAYFLETDVAGEEQPVDSSFLRLLLLYRIKSNSVWLRSLMTPTLRRRRKKWIDILRMAQYYRRGDFVAFFRAFVRLPILERLASSAGVDFSEFRYRSLWTLKKAYGRSKLPLEKIALWLAFRNSGDARLCAEECGFEVNGAGLVDVSCGEKKGNEKVREVPYPWHRWPDDELKSYELV